ncbi:MULTISPECIES: nuclear transport factor 2 family protein [unclassified Streptosporangium]|uniref:nuclear transport factor 2 family protein n=1 Tax=unclassified Streptosporangium TaxID=2632669 RepID=UPI002E2CED5A|nr:MULTISPECIES: nuclear transport factor 2 family protein [unclassified Streptosporangium]
MTTPNALVIAQTYVRAVESKNRDGVAATLADTVRHIFPISYGPVEHPQAVFEGKDEVLAYIDSLFNKFSSMRWPAPDWTVSADGSRAFLEGKGDGVVAHSRSPYRNTYMIRFDLENGLIVRVTEYANSEYYVAQNIPPVEVEIRAAERAAAL